MVADAEKILVEGNPPIETGSVLMPVLPHVHDTVTVTYVPAVQLFTLAGMVVRVYGRLCNPFIAICEATAVCTAVSVELERIAVRSPTVVAACNECFRNSA